MTPMRMVCLVVLIFFLTLPMAFRLESQPDRTAKDLIPQQNGDPEIDAMCLDALEDSIGGDLDRAIVKYTKVIARDPKYAYAYILRGDAWKAKEDWDRAISDYDRAIRVDPNNREARERAEDARKVRAAIRMN
jgi:tetratricopeptide (TPR) repeat protein